MDYERNIKELMDDGVTLIPNAYTAEECKDYIDKFESIVEGFKQRKRPLHPNCIVIENPFRHDTSLAKLIHHPAIDKIVGQLIDEDYVLINSNVLNRRIRNDIVTGGLDIGETWHTDSRYLGGKRMEQGFGFICCTMFNDFSPENGGTMYVPKSHLRRERPERQGDYSYKQICGEAGTMAIFDTGLWHKGGNPTNKDRWSMCSYYGPWFVKPYFRYPEMLGSEFGKDLSRPLRKLFHYNSTPPLTEDERRNTLVKE